MTLEPLGLSEEVVTEDFLEEVAAMLRSAGREGHFGERELPGPGYPRRNLIFMPPLPCPPMCFLPSLHFNLFSFM